MLRNVYASHLRDCLLFVLSVGTLSVLSGCTGVVFQDGRHGKYQNAQGERRLQTLGGSRVSAEESVADRQGEKKPKSIQDALDAPSAFLPYYEQLNDAEKQVYALIYDAYLSHRTSVEYPFVLPNLPPVVWAVMNDHPDLFWMRQDHKSTVTEWEDGSVSTLVELRYFEFDKPVDVVQKEIEREVARWFPNINKYKTDFEKEKYIHDQIILNTTYDREPDYRQSIYSVFINKKAVCEGYARAMQYAMLRYGLRARYIPGEKGKEGHSWTQVIIDGKCYNVDVTDDVLKPSVDKNIREKMPAYFKFNLTDAELRQLGYVRDSDLGKDIALSVCGTEEFSFEETFGPEALQEVYSKYMDIPPHHVVRTREQHDAVMREAGLNAKQAHYRVHEIVTGKALMREIYNLDAAKNKRGYVDEVWQTRFDNYRHHRSSVSYVDVTKVSFLAFSDEYYDNGK